MIVELCTDSTLQDWITLRVLLWPQAREKHEEETRLILRNSDEAGFLARSKDGIVIGFAEVSLRHDYVNGCDHTPVAFLEGIYVSPAWRLQKVGRKLCDAVEKWALAKGSLELASDADIENAASQKMHNALGFIETEKVIFFRKNI